MGVAEEGEAMIAAGDLLHEPQLRRAYVVVAVGKGIVLYREYIGKDDKGRERVASQHGFEAALVAGDIKRVEKGA
jgi:hypothetical protein